MPPKVRDILKLLADDGWYLVTTRGSHRQLKHPTKSGRVTVHGQPGDDIAPGTLNSILKQSRLKKRGHLMRYAVVIEKCDRNYSAYVPDLPGCVATGTTIVETQKAIREAVELHLAGMREDGIAVPPPSSQVDYIDIAA